MKEFAHRCARRSIRDDIPPQELRLLTRVEEDDDVGAGDACVLALVAEAELVGRLSGVADDADVRPETDAERCRELRQLVRDLLQRVTGSVPPPTRSRTAAWKWRNRMTGPFDQIALPEEIDGLKCA